MFGAFGFLPIAVPAVAFIAMRLGAGALPASLPGSRRGDRAVAGMVLTFALMVATVRILSAMHVLTQSALLGTVAIGLVAAASVRRVRDPLASRVPLREVLTTLSLPLVAVASASLALAVIAAFYLPLWQWDALGYHLPFVNFALQAHSLDGVPEDIPFLSTYPHNVELAMIALRAMLPDDRLVDLAQVPFGVAGAITTAALARHWDASRPGALVAGAGWLVVPAVFLQLPTNYVDVASAAFLLMAIYFALAPSSTRTLVLSGIALGLYLGSKPQAPVGTAIVGLLLLYQGVRAGQGRAVTVALVLACALGAQSYVHNTARHHNPIWPVRLDLGPVHLPGTMPMQALLDSGANAARLHGPLLRRVVGSFFALRSDPVFDMRIGGFGLLFLLSLPFAAWALVRRKDPIAIGAVLATFASPDPAVARYILAFPAVILALASSRVGAISLGRWPQCAVGIAVGLLGAWQVIYAFPGLAGEGPPLFSYPSMTAAERLAAVGADGKPTPYVQARDHVEAAETFAFDKGLDFPYLTWTPDLRYRVVWIADGLSDEALDTLLETERVRVVASGEGCPLDAWIRRRPERFVRLFSCKSVPCAVYARR